MKYLYSIIFILYVSVLTQAQTFNENYGVFEIGWADIARNVEYINDSIYIFYSDQHPEGGRRPCVSNISISGNLIWSQCFGIPQTGRSFLGANHLNGNEDETTFSAAHVYQTTNSETGEDLFLGELMVYDQNFDTLYTTLVGNSINFYILSQARFTQDGGIICSGWTHTTEPDGPLNNLLVKFNEQGEEQWQTINSTFASSYDQAYSVVETDSGDFILGSTTRTAWGEPNRPVLTKFDSEGNFMEREVFGNTQYSEGWANINPLSDGNFIFCSSKQENAQEDNYRIVKFDENLDTIWDKSYYFYSSEVALVQIKETTDGNFIGCGIWEDQVTTHDFGVLLKLDSEGELLWHRLYQHANEGIFQLNRLYDLVEVPDNEGYVACGERNGGPLGQNYWVLKVDEMGCLVEGCDTITSVTELRALDQLEIALSPNPASELLNVFIPELPSNLNGTSLTLTLRNLEGKEIEHTPISMGNTTYMLDVRNHPKGTYLLSLNFGGKELVSERVVLN